MKIHNPIGSKERFLEMFQGVNRIRLNEVNTGTMQTGTQLIEKAFNELQNKEANVVQTNTQTSGEDNFVEIVTNDQEGNEITFTFKVSSTEDDQDGVFNVGNAVLSQFKIKSGTLNVDMPENMQAVQEFNANHSSEIMDAISEYANFETETSSVSDEMYEEAVKFIDKVPYKKGTEQMQTNKAYADQKPTNPEVRVKSPELDKFVSEADDYADDDYTQDAPMEDPMADPTEYSAADAAAILKDPDADDKTIKGIDPYTELDNDYDDDAEEPSEEEQALYGQAYDNIVASGNNMPTHDQIAAEVLRMKRETGQAEPFEKKRASNPEARRFFSMYEGEQGGGENVITDEIKKEIILQARELLRTEIGGEPTPSQITARANQLFGNAAISEGEGEQKSDYPDQMGKKFKPKNQMPKKKKKPQSIVKISEDNEEQDFSDIGKGIGGNIAEEDKDEVPSGWGAKKYAQADMKKDSDMGNEIPYDAEFKSQLPEPEPKASMDTDPAPDVRRNWWDIPEPYPYTSPIWEGDKIEKLEKDKEEAGDVIAGGKADGESPEKFDQEQIKMGLKVEMEHTDDPMVAIEITMDHLTEFPDYYTRLDKMEKQAKGDTKSEGLVDSTPEEEELTDELLGFKPHNVGDYTDEEFDYAAAERNYHDKEDYDKNKVYDADEEYVTEFNQLIDEFGLNNVKAMFPSGLEGFRDSRIRGNYSMDAIKQSLRAGSRITEEDGMDEYQGEIGDQFQDGDGNQFSVRNKVKGGVTLQGQGGEKEIATRDIQFLKKLGESKKVKKNIITEEQVRIARQTIGKRGSGTGMTKEEAVKLLIRHNIK